MLRLHRTDRRKLVTIFIIQLYRQKYLFRQSILVDSTVTLHLRLVVRNKRWNSLQVEQEAERTKKMLARFLKNCESIVSQGVVSFMLHDACTCMHREPVTRELHMQKLSII